MTALLPSLTDADSVFVIAEKYLESPEKVDYQLFSPFIANEAKQKYKKQAIIFFKGQIISEFYQRLNTHLPQNVWFLTEMPYFGVL